MASPQLSHIKETCLYVSDLDQTRAFYHDRLGLPIVAHIENKHIFFRVGDCMLLCFNPESSKNQEVLPPHSAEGKQHIAFGVLISEYDFWKEKIIALGIKITSEYEWREGLKSFYFNDPDGHVLEIVPNNLWDEN